MKIIDPQAEIPTKVSNLSRKVFKLARKCTDKNQDILYQTISGIHKKPELSPDFLAAGLSVTDLVNLDFDVNLPMNLKIKHIVELKAVLTKNKLSWKFAVEWLKLLQKLDMEISPKSVALQWKRICKKKTELVRAKKNVENFLESEYNYKYGGALDTSSDASTGNHSKRKSGELGDSGESHSNIYNTVKLEMFADINVCEFVILEVFALLKFANLGLSKVNF